MSDKEGGRSWLRCRWCTTSRPRDHDDDGLGGWRGPARTADPAGVGAARRGLRGVVRGLVPVLPAVRPDPLRVGYPATVRPGRDRGGLYLPDRVLPCDRVRAGLAPPALDRVGQPRLHGRAAVRDLLARARVP